ncbi:MAG: biotin carboxylase N-terminal domain-containing protein [Sterolibacterium sp.]|jgi:geranyl-CoA carboxylase alpha subunit
MFTKILIANRGEIVTRVARTARRLGYPTVAVYSEADRNSPHAAACDEAVAIGGRLPAESYLDIDKIILACRKSGADALHPGYGFLSENAEFAERCAAAGVLFIGPPPRAIRLMGDKAGAKRRLLAAGVPCIPGYQDEEQSDQRLMTEAARIGFPLMIKASAGGGGRGMRRVAQAAELPAALASARSEATAAFGSDTLILERLVSGARHVEMQIFADTHGNVIHLFERDCSVQRRHQKVIEEAPSPAVTPQLRAAMGAAACAAARTAGYVGAGTVEFLLDRDGRFYFMEMNTRLQVEHPVTELIMGLDLVEWQLRVANGEPLPCTQEQLHSRGHAIEARLYAEDAEHCFLPQSGRLLRWRPAAGVRTDHALADGNEITAYYDPLLAKVIAHGESREEARRGLIAALRETVVLGLTSNKAFLLGCLEHPEFSEGRANTDFVAAHFSDSLDVPPAAEAMAAAALLFLAQATACLPQPWLANWHSNGQARALFELSLGTVVITPLGDARFRIASGEKSIDVEHIGLSDDALQISIDGLRLNIAYAWESPVRLHLDVAGRNVMVEDLGRRPPQSKLLAESGAVLPPMNGRVIVLLVSEGQPVRRGDPLLVLESMKMEHTLTASRDGIVSELNVRVGDQVAPGKRVALIVGESIRDAAPA